MKCIVSGSSPMVETTIASFDDRPTPIWTDTIQSPSFMTVADDYLFAVTENSYFANLFAYRHDTVGTYRMTDQHSFDGRGLCHIVYSPRNHILFGSCYGSGTVVYAEFDPESGKFGSVRSLIQTGDWVSRQRYVLLNQAEDRLLTVNQGLDTISMYEIQASELYEKKYLRVKENSGPRQIRLSRDESLLYMMAEHSNEMVVYDTKSWKCKQTIRALPQGKALVSRCSAFCITPDERFLYVANRHADVISVFSIDQDGLLTFCDLFECGGRNPSYIALSPDGTQLAICCHDSNWVVFKHLHPETGMATHTVREIPFATPSCIVFK